MEVNPGSFSPRVCKQMHLMALGDQFLHYTLQIPLSAAAGDVSLPNQCDLQRRLHLEHCMPVGVQAQARLSGRAGFFDKSPQVPQAMSRRTLNERENQLANAGPEAFGPVRPL